MRVYLIPKISGEYVTGYNLATFPLEYEASEDTAQIRDLGSKTENRVNFIVSALL